MGKGGSGRRDRAGTDQGDVSSSDDERPKKKHNDSDGPRPCGTGSAEFGAQNVRNDKRQGSTRAIARTLRAI